MPPRRPLAERFREKVNKNGPLMPGMDAPCWVWTAAIAASGYGVIERNRQAVGAHVIAWELGAGKPVPPGGAVLHRCDNRPCVRFDHLFLGTRTTNAADKVAKNRQAKGVMFSHAKLNDEAVRTIRASTASVTELAAHFGVCGRHIRAVRARSIWKHVV